MSNSGPVGRSGKGNGVLEAEGSFQPAQNVTLSLADELYGCLATSESEKRNKNGRGRSVSHKNQVPENKKCYENDKMQCHSKQRRADDSGKGNRKEKKQRDEVVNRYDITQQDKEQIHFKMNVTGSLADDLYSSLERPKEGNPQQEKYERDNENSLHSNTRFIHKENRPRQHRSASRQERSNSYTNEANPPLQHDQASYRNMNLEEYRQSNEGWERVKTRKKNTNTYNKFDDSTRKGHRQDKSHTSHAREKVVNDKQTQEMFFSENKNFASLQSESNRAGFQNDQAAKEIRTPQHVLGYKELVSLTDKDDPYETLKGLANRVNGFERTLMQPLRPDMLILVLKLLSKLCKLEFDDLKIQLLSGACHPNFLDQLSKHIVAIPIERNMKRKANAEHVLEDVLTFLEEVINLLPTKAAENFGGIFMMTVTMLKINEGQKSVSISENMKKKFEQLKTQFETCLEEQERKKKTANTAVPVQNYEAALDDFRDISLFPTSDDILSDFPPEIRPNIVHGAYENVDHYLDIQFRLLREDFISPLREGISEYTNMTDKRHVRKISNVKIYHKVYFLNPKVLKGKVGLVVCFDPDKRFKKVIWEHSKRLIYGSLLIFSNDNFKTILFGTVMDRDIAELKKERILVELSEGSNVSNELFISEYVMAESSVYFEPYFHVMKALQEMKPLTFPMESYIVNAEMSDNPPKYLMQDGGQTLDIDGHAVCVLNHNSWPSAEALRLDESQYNAFKASLTREFVVVQGPPGTGKTFLGLKVARVLLKNAPIWNASKKPILVVCYTNHALDQFLEGLVPLTRNIVRVGGQSKSEVLQSLNLREKRKVSKGMSVFPLMRECRYRMSECLNSIKIIQAELELLLNHIGIISLSILKEFGISRQQLTCFETFNPQLTERYFSDWLEYGMYEDLPPDGLQENNAQNAELNDENPPENQVDPELLTDDMEDMRRHQLDDIFDLELDIHEVVPRLSFAVDLRQMEAEIEWINMQLSYLENQSQQDPSLIQNMQEQSMVRDDLQLKYDYIKQQLAKEVCLDQRTLHTLLQQNNLWELQPEDRWHLYRHWVERLRMALLFELQRLEANFRMESRMYEDAQQIHDLQIMKNSLVVGMTTTGAARLQRLLNALKPKIVIVEEAAEVFESHIVVSLTHHCEHLILIGDHKQLRPSPAVYKLAKDYNFDISLFERMLKNNMHCEILKVQHRMRPEIVELIVPTIYQELHNHSSVLQYQKIHGVLKNMYFITHNHLEEEVDDISSHRNTHEGDFLIEFCRYLVLQGYKPSRITILATYSGQMFYLRNVRKNHKMLSEVRITVVDNFQGEENDIILLSLVRNNKAGKIGFLRTENRVCVALSRARMGLYIMGNMDMLSKNSEVWLKVKETLKGQEAIGTHLTLRCQVHSSQFTSVCCAADFNLSPEGGCRQLCGAELSCGHKCKSACHVQNREHINYNCFEQCERIPDKCELQHQCMRRCWEDCGNCLVMLEKILPCGHSQQLQCGIKAETYSCQQRVEEELPDCGHKVMKPCCRDLNTFPCTYPCENRLPCGHVCLLNCHARDDPDHLEYQCPKPCARKNAGCKENHLCEKLCCEDCGDCRVKVERQLLYCDHMGRMPCSQDPETYRCQRKCERKLQCGHDCPNNCSELCGNCSVMVTKSIPSCGHPVRVKCSEAPDPNKCMSPCKKILPCGHPCTTKCSAMCTSKCQELVVSRVRPMCGHAVNIPCFMQNENLAPDSEKLLALCQVPCRDLLECEHRCSGTCGECMQGRIHKSCGQNCGKVLICGHSCNIPCAESCPPCTRKCMYRCKHSKCSRKCGQPCIQCKEPCDWSCKHRKCKKFCFELCDREPCDEPCDKLLKCNHPCIGFCGETCPPLCRICNEDEVTEIFFGTEDEPDARFVLLEDCNHVFEATGLEQWMSQTDEEITLKLCPRCKKEITKTQRYMNIVKKVYKDICLVKNRVFGEIKAIEASRDRLTARLLAIENYSNLIKDSKEYEALYDKLLLGLKPILRHKSNILSSIDVGTLRVQIEIFSQLVDNYCKVQKDLDYESKMKVCEYLDILLRVVKKQDKKMGKQQVNDFNFEIQRFLRICQLYKLKSETGFRTNSYKQEVKISFEAAYRISKSIERFTNTQDAAMKNALETFCREIKSAQKITDAERKMIVQVMGFKQGHWYKCPNGHPYVIGECGGAMVISKCNECGAQIGGGSHRLLADNRVATEMDGAIRPAWPQ